MSPESAAKMLEAGELSQQDQFRWYLLDGIKRADAPAVVDLLIDINSDLTGHNEHVFGYPGDAMYDGVVSCADELIGDYRNKGEAFLEFYLSSSGISRLAISCEGDEVTVEPTDNSSETVKKKWEALAATFGPF